MCLSTVYKGGAATPENMLAEYVVSVLAEDGAVCLTDITGEETRLRGALRSIDLVKNRIFIDAE